MGFVILELSAQMLWHNTDSGCRPISSWFINQTENLTLDDLVCKKKRLCLVCQGRQQMWDVSIQ